MKFCGERLTNLPLRDKLSLKNVKYSWSKDFFTMFTLIALLKFIISLSINHENLNRRNLCTGHQCCHSDRHSHEKGGKYRSRPQWTSTLGCGSYAFWVQSLYSELWSDQSLLLWLGLHQGPL